MEDAANFTFQTLRPSALSHDLQPCNGLLHASDGGVGEENCRMPQRMQPEKLLCIKSFARRTSEEHLDMCEHAPFFFIAFREVER